jgi:exopolysaccharide biosynthesis WecB/TagA/CpsF family protein
MSELSAFEILGLRIHTGPRAAAVRRVLELAERGPASVAFVNMHTANLACERGGYREVLNGFSLVFNDGIGLEVGGKLRGARFVHDLPGNVVVPEILRGWPGGAVRIFLMGSDAETIARAAEHIAREFPSATVTGTHPGYFAGEEEAAIVAAINASRSDVLLVGMGNPHQEEFLARHKGALAVRLAIGVGGLVDIWGGKLVHYPAWATRLRLHWLMRLIQEPRRLWRRYLLGAPVFFWRVLRYGRNAPPAVTAPSPA